MAIMAHMVSLVFALSYKNTFPNSYVFRACITPSQTITALCIERCKQFGHGDHMANNVHIVPIHLVYQLFNTSPNSYVFRVCITISQAIMALCIKSLGNLVMVTIWRTWSIWSRFILFLSWLIHPHTVMCSGYV